MKLAFLIFTAIFLSGVCGGQGLKMEPLPLTLPHPLFEGTPEPPNVPNLERPLGKPRPPFLAPAGTVNVAKGKPVTSSDSEPVVGSLELITDGNKSGMDGSFVELKPGVQNIVIDLEAKHTIYAIVVWHYHKEARAYDDVIIQAADDPDFIGNVQTLFNNDSDNAAGFGIGKNRRYVETSEGKLIDARGVEGRYLRLVSNGSDKTQANHYVEVEVYGKPVK
jgi:hypothetical protein